MTSLFDFIKAEQQVVSLPSHAQSGDNGHAISTAVALTLQDAAVPSDKALKFAKKLNDLVTSDSFLKELSDGIREPGLTESEDAFVERCKKTMIDLIDKRLG